MKTIFEDIIILMLGGLLVSLKLMNQLSFYVRSDYFMFTFVAGLVLVCVGGVKLVWDICGRENEHHHDHEHASGLTLLAAGIVVIACFIIPRKPLSAQTAIRRNTQNTFMTSSLSNTLISKPQGSPLLEKADTSTYTIADWISLFFSDPEPENYVGKSVQVEGFVQPHPDGTFAVARFMITCCAVDATPISLNVDSQKGSLKDDEWVRVTGVFQVKNISGGRVLVIQPTKTEKIAVPANPYFY